VRTPALRKKGELKRTLIGYIILRRWKGEKSKRLGFYPLSPFVLRGKKGRSKTGTLHYRGKMGGEVSQFVALNNFPPYKRGEKKSHPNLLLNPSIRERRKKRCKQHRDRFVPETPKKGRDLAD